MSKEGIILAARYSYGACKKAKELEILQFLKKAISGDESSLLELEKGLKELNPYPYYQRIANAFGIKDPFDLKVVKAYWIGNELLSFFSLPKPHHNFAILEDPEVVVPGLPLEGLSFGLNLCWVNYGKVEEKRGNKLEIRTDFLSYQKGKWVLLKEKLATVEKGLLEDVEKGRLVAVHWLEAREIIKEEEKKEILKIKKEFLFWLNRFYLGTD